jgi:hypothetical protein
MKRCQVGGRRRVTGFAGVSCDRALPATPHAYEVAISHMESALPAEATKEFQAMPLDNKPRPERDL